MGLKGGPAPFPVLETLFLRWFLVPTYIYRSYSISVSGSYSRINVFDQNTTQQMLSLQRKV